MLIGPMGVVEFRGGSSGPWVVSRQEAVVGEPLAAVSHLAVLEPGDVAPAEGPTWALRGAVSSARYATRTEVDALRLASEGLGRGSATCAALIPITKSAAWWALAQDERRDLLEEQSHHIAVGSRYLPAVARRLHHGRDLGEPWDFLTWFEYAPGDAAAFEELVGLLRASPEWRYVEREHDLRLVREA